MYEMKEKVRIYFRILRCDEIWVLKNSCFEIWLYEINLKWVWHMVRIERGERNPSRWRWCGTAWWCWEWHVPQRKRGNALRSLWTVSRYWIWFAVSLSINSLSFSIPSSALLNPIFTISLLTPTLTMTILPITNPLQTETKPNSIGTF